MKPTIIIAIIILFGMPTSNASAACCSANSYYNWAQVQRQNNASRLRAAQQQQRLCQSLRGRTVMWTGCH